MKMEYLNGLFFHIANENSITSEKEQRFQTLIPKIEMKNNLTNIFLLNMKHWNKLSPSPSLPLFFIHRPVHQSSLLYPTLSLPPFLSLPPSHQKKSHFFPHSSRVDKRPPSCLFFFQCLLTNKSGQKGTL